MTMITPSYLGETIEYSSLHACRSTLEDPTDASSGFRLAVSPGGCSGLAADISVRREPVAGEAVVERDGVKLFLPAESRILLDGVTIDFADTPSQTGLIFKDPKQVSCSGH